MKNKKRRGVWVLSVHTRLGDTLKVQVDTTCLQGTATMINLRGVQIAGYDAEKPLQSMFVKWENVVELVGIEPEPPKQEPQSPFAGGTTLLPDSAFMGGTTVAPSTQKVPILKGCPNKTCFCTGACQQIIGYRNAEIGEYFHRNNPDSSFFGK